MFPSNNEEVEIRKGTMMIDGSPIANTYQTPSLSEGYSYRYRFAEVMLTILVFTKTIGLYQAWGVDLDIIAYPFYLLYFIFNLTSILSNRNVPYKLFLYLGLSSLVSILWLNLKFGGFLKSYLPIVIIVSSIFQILKESDIIEVFKLYVRLTFWTAIFGILQVVLYDTLKIDLMTDVPGKVNSVAAEPSHYAALLMPGLTYTYLNFKEYKVYFIVMLITLIMTFNLTAYLVATIVFTFASFNPWYLLLTIPLGYYLFFNVLPDFSKNFNIRYEDTLLALGSKSEVLSTDLKVNGTTLSFYSNWEVAKYDLSRSPLLGAGLGGHEEMYYRRFESTPFSSNYYYRLNAKSAHSLTIRVISETGLLGAALYFYTLFGAVIRAKNTPYFAIALSCFSHFLCKTLKLGAYIDYGTPFFFCMLLLSARLVAQLAHKKASAQA